MNVKIQLASFLAFILYGFLLGTLYELVLKKRKVELYLSFILLSPLFARIIFLVNGGKLHPYFFITFAFSCVFSKVAVNHLKKRLKQLRPITKNVIMRHRGRL